MEHQKGRRSAVSAPSAPQKTSPFAPRLVPDRRGEAPAEWDARADEALSDRLQRAQRRAVAAIQPGRDASAPPSQGTVQRVVSLAALVAKHNEIRDASESATYTGTIDDSTPAETANAVGSEWVGEGATSQYYGASAWPSKVSSDESRQYRPPMLKASGVMEDNFQANYEAKRGGGTEFFFNAHVTISDLEKDTWEDKKKEQEKPKKEKTEQKDALDDDDGGSGMGNLFDLE